MVRIHIEQSDLTASHVDAIVNAANNDLVFGGGVAGAIAREGGPAIQAECRKLSPIKIGEAALTTGGRLAAHHVIHAASMALGGQTTAEALADSVWASLQIADAKGLKSIAFPAIGTGIAGFPLQECARIMLRIFAEYSGRQSASLQDIHIVLYSTAACETFRDVYDKIFENPEKIMKNDKK